MIRKVKSKEFAVREAWPEGISWGESETDHCIYVGDINALRKAGVPIGIGSSVEPSVVSEWLRRYQIILPYVKNNGSSFDPKRMEETLKCLVDEFGGFTIERDIAGAWCGDGEIISERNYRVTCDVPDTPRNRRFFINFKEVCQLKFEQEEIWLTSFPIDKIP